MTMKIHFHGGKCCGIKTIAGFPFGTRALEEPQRALTQKEFRQPDKYGHEVQSVNNFFCEVAPKESSLERLDRYLQWLKKNRPKSLVEVCLVVESQSGPHWDQTCWLSVLRGYGFKKVTDFKNCNSGNTVRVLHLDMQNMKKIRKTAVKKKAARKANAPWNS